MSVQLELFSQSKENAGLTAASGGNSFLARIWNYEKTILIIIAVAITSIVSFSLGVEKGKKLSMSKSSFQASKEVEAPRPEAVKPAVKPVKKEGALKETAPIERRNYVIQLASYKTRSYAQKEAESLKKKGLSPLVSPKGNYMVLYVGNFTNRESALALLGQLKKRFKDCYVRRL